LVHFLSRKLFMLSVYLYRKDRITIQEKEREEHKQRELEMEAKRLAEERREQTRRVEYSVTLTTLSK